jgi:NADH-quinone oxidoreductase subunit N
MHGPHIDWAAFSPLLSLPVGGVVVLLVGLLPARVARTVLVPLLSLVAIAAFAGLAIWRFAGSSPTLIISSALSVDDLSLVLDFVLAAAGAAAVLLSWRARAPDDAGHGEYFAMLLFALFGMAVLVASTNLVTLFLGYELLSIPLYVMSAAETRRASSLEAGLKYLIVGSVGSATLLYGLAMVYGATGSTDFGPIAHALSSPGDLVSDPLLLTGIAFSMAGLAFKASVAPFHQWTPDVYEGAPTPVTAFMAVATKAAAFGIALRFFDLAVARASDDWGPWLAVLATVTIIVGNVGALGQSSLKRLLAWSSVAQAGYLLAGVVVGTSTGVRATVFYLAVYLVMNLAAFSVIVARERETALGDHIDAVAGLGRSRPLLAWPLTLAMLSLAGIPATAGFIGKVFLIDALVGQGYTWLAVVLVMGSAVSLAYYLRVVGAMWLRPAVDRPAAPVMAGAEEGGERAGIEVQAVALIFGVASVVLGIIPQPLFHLVGHTIQSFPNLV